MSPQISQAWHHVLHGDYCTGTQGRCTHPSVAFEPWRPLSARQAEGDGAEPPGLDASPEPWAPPSPRPHLSPACLGEAPAARPLTTPGAQCVSVALTSPGPVLWGFSDSQGDVAALGGSHRAPCSEDTLSPRRGPRLWGLISRQVLSLGSWGPSFTRNTKLRKTGQKGRRGPERPCEDRTRGGDGPAEGAAGAAWGC